MSVLNNCSAELTRICLFFFFFLSHMSIRTLTFRYVSTQGQWQDSVRRKFVVVSLAGSGEIGGWILAAARLWNIVIFGQCCYILFHVTQHITIELDESKETEIQENVSDKLFIADLKKKCCCTST